MSSSDDLVADSIALDPNINDDTSDGESVRTSSTQSLSESIREYREIHGRTFSQKVEYWAPNDERQQDAQDFNHFWITEHLGNELYLAPIGDNPQRILDLGTGTGIWAIEMADKFPSAEVIGVDISPIQPGWVPTNCRFQIDDFEQEWTWPQDHFDFVHARNLEGCFTDLSKILKEIYDHTKPGGWFQIIEFDGQARAQAVELGEDHIFNRWWRWICEGLEKMGKSHSNVVSGRFKQGLLDVGYTELVERKWKIPIGTWPAKPELKRLGFCNREYVDMALEGFMLFILKDALGFTSAEVELIILEMRAALRDNSLAPFYNMNAIYARKPMEEEKKKD
ncbi:methyltransferase [Colletotrichum musicola]|uniref:Methyltransferase n=1 Tax=Colletotrichum musicola TaxID=2175873 RepID=A0A8H6JH77_9PEZI|nr:methyltransferase [Colletotrichum musicola]